MSLRLIRHLFLLVTILFSLQALSETGLYFDGESNQYFINGKVSFTIKPAKSEKFLDKIKFSVDNGPYKDYSGKINFSKDGFHLVRFRAVDPVLNWSPTQNFRIYVDLTSPISHVDWSGKTYSNGQTLFVSESGKMILSAQDNLSGISKIYWRQQGDSKSQKYRRKMTFKEGVYKLQMAAVDNVGNTESWREYDFVVDAKAPVTKAEIRGNTFIRQEKSYIDKGSFISLTAKDDKSGVKEIQYKINDGQRKIYNHKILLDRAFSEVKFRSVDKVGNLGSWKSLKVNLDSVPPKMSIKTEGKYIKVAGRIFARKGLKLRTSVYDKESGARSIFINNEVIKGRQKILSFDKEGTKDFHFGAEDNVGNFANSESITVVVDETPPTSKMESTNKFYEKDGVFMSSLPNSIEFRAEDAGVGVSYVEYSFDGKNYQKAKGPIDLATWNKSKRTVFYRSVDRLGNAEKSKKMVVYVRKRGPRVGLFVEREDHPEIALSELFNKKRRSKRLPASKKSSELKRKEEIRDELNKGQIIKE